MEDSRDADRTEGALRVITGLDISESKAINLLVDVLCISKSKETNC